MSERERIMVARAGTRLDEPGWYYPEGIVLTWDMRTGERPAFAVRRGDVLLNTGIPLGGPTVRGA